jgi:uncharacterized protein
LLASFLSKYLADVIVLSVVVLTQYALARWLLARASSRWARAGILTLAVCSFLAITVALAMRSARVSRHFSDAWQSWGRAGLLGWSTLCVFVFFALVVWRVLPAPRRSDRAGRRWFLKSARAAAIAGPSALLGYATFVERTNIRVREQVIPIPDLDPDLEGLRLVQVTDIHLSPFLTARELRRAVDMANETKAHLALVTGDLITGPGDPLDSCLDELARLRADAGVFGCMGNHEVYAGTQEYTQSRGAQLGMRFLRSERALVRFGNAPVNLAGVDYQRKGEPYLVGAERLVEPGAFNILLSHNPDVFPVAARKGFPLTIAGHTHGGQVRFEILRQDLNIARFFTPYVDGLYRREGAAAFVSRGIGTIVLPARFGSAPEVALLRLVRDQGREWRS